MTQHHRGGQPTPNAYEKGWRRCTRCARWYPPPAPNRCHDCRVVLRRNGRKTPLHVTTT